MEKRQIDVHRIEALRKELGFKDPGIFEKSVYALNLLSEVLRVYPGLVFKGGTSLLLHIFPEKYKVLEKLKVTVPEAHFLLVNDISIGLPAELSARRQQYEYYRGKLMSFKEYE